MDHLAEARGQLAALAERQFRAPLNWEWTGFMVQASTACFELRDSSGVRAENVPTRRAYATISSIGALPVMPRAPGS